MASNTHNPFPSRKLGQLLQEKQEPFKLKIYLLERGYSRTEANSESLGSCDPPEFLKRNKKTKMVSRFSKTVRALANKLVSLRTLDTNCEQRINTEEVHTTVLTSCSGQIAAERGKYNQSCKENKQQQLSPVSVLEEAHSDQNSPVRNAEQETATFSTKKRNTIFSLENSSPKKQLINTVTSLEYSKITSQLWKSPWLLFDCMKEVVQIHKLKNSGQQQQDFLCAEDIGRLLHDNLLEWSKQSIKDGNRTAIQLINFNLSTLFEDWKYDREEQRIGIAKVMGDSILDDIIINEFVHQESCKPKGLYISKFMCISSKICI